MTSTIFAVALFSILLVAPSLTQERLHKPIIDFALSMTASSRGEDLLFSPFSITSILNIVLLGAQGNTAQELRQVLQYEDPDAEPRFHQLYREFLEDIAKENDVEISVKNKMFIQESCNVSYDYLQRSKKYYFTSAEGMNFRNPDEAQEYVNRWVSRETKGKISELIKSPLPNSTILLAANVVYFNGLWKEPFVVQETKKGDFFVSSEKQVEATYMGSKRYPSVKLAYSQDLGTQVVVIPYKGGRWNMYVLNPHKKGVEGLTELEEKLTTEGFLEMVDQANRSTLPVLQLWLPRVAARMNIDLKAKLETLGLVDLFQPQSANLNGIFTDLPLYVSDAFHETFLNVTEKGTEAATGAGVGFVQHSVPAVVKINNPFIMIITENKAKIPFIWMRVVDPTSSIYLN